MGREEEKRKWGVSRSDSWLELEEAGREDLCSVGWSPVLPARCIIRESHFTSLSLLLTKEVT